MHTLYTLKCLEMFSGIFNCVDVCSKLSVNVFELSLPVYKLSLTVLNILQVFTTITVTTSLVEIWIQSNGHPK